MYDELANILLYDAGWLEQGITQTEHDIAEHLRQAADAIEELSHSLDLMGDANAKLRNQVPEWIPVTERLPEDGSDVFAYLKYEVGGRIAAANYDKGTWQDCVMGGLYRTEEGVVTHWMPIPQPPKEENK